MRTFICKIEKQCLDVCFVSLEKAYNFKLSLTLFFPKTKGSFSKFVFCNLQKLLKYIIVKSVTSSS